MDHFAEQNRNYLLLEYINGQDLRQFIKQNPVPSEQTVLNWSVQIADMLIYLHSRQPPIIHRDLTPDNLVLRDHETLTLIDFGAANELVGQATGTLVGKQAYIAPEQFRGKTAEQSDLYALGCTMFFLLTGEDPEPLSTSHPKESNNKVSEECDQLVADLTEMDLENRIGTALDAKNRILELLASLYTVA